MGPDSLLFGHNQFNLKEFRPQFSGYKQAIIFDVIGNAIEDVNPAIAVFRLLGVLPDLSIPPPHLSEGRFVQCGLFSKH